MRAARRVSPSTPVLGVYALVLAGHRRTESALEVLLQNEELIER
jgi:hypothetical protein